MIDKVIWKEIGKYIGEFRGVGFIGGGSFRFFEGVREGL